MKITCRVSLFSRGNVGTSEWIPIGFRKSGDKEWDVLTESGEKIGRCWGPENARMFSFGSDGHTGFHLERLKAEKQWDVADPWVVAAARSSDNTVDVAIAPPDDEAQPHFRTAEKTVTLDELAKKKSRARLYQSFSDSHKERALRKVRQLQEKLEQEAPK